MSSSPSIRGVAGRRVGILLLGLALACVGALSFAGSQAKAAPFKMEFDKGQVNLGFAFKGAEILPGKSAIPAAVSNPGFNPALPVSATNPTTVQSPAGTPLFDYDSLDPATFTRPGAPPDGTNALPNSFTPLGCGTPVTFGLYAAIPYDETPSPFDQDTFVWNPASVATGRLLAQPLANAGGPAAGEPAGAAEYYRVLNRGAILRETAADGAQPAGATLKVDSTAGFPATGQLKVGSDVVSYTGKNEAGDTFTGVSGLTASVNDDAPVKGYANFANPFNPALPNVELEGPYPAADTLWQPYAIGVNPLIGGGFAPVPLGVNPDGTFPNQTPFSGDKGLNYEENTNPSFCPNPAKGSAAGEVDDQGNVSIPSADFKMPIMIVPNPLDGSPVPITIESEGAEVTGKYDRATGKLDLSGPLEVRVLTGLASNPLGSYCALRLPDRTGGGNLGLTTGFSLPTAVGFGGSPFTTGATNVEGLQGPGALTGTWNVTANSVSVGEADCGTVNSVSKGLGGIWLSAGVAAPTPFPTCAEEGKIGTWPNCEVAKATIGKVTVKGPKKVKRNKVSNWTITIPNTGNVPATGVRLAVSGKGVKLSAKVKDIAAGGRQVIKARAKFKKVGKVKVTFRVTSQNAGTKTVRATVTVRR